MQLAYNKIILSKKFILVSSFVLLILLSVVLNIAFSAFTNRSENAVANIKVAGMNYNITINGISERKITISENKTTTANIVINALNNRDSKYELIYKVCSDASCTNYIEKPESLTVEYSSRTIDTIAGAITSNGSKQIRIAVTNTSANTYFIELGINAGYIHNTLVIQDLITTEYNEEDVKIAAIINGEISTTLPTTNDYITSVICETNEGVSNATGTAIWNGTKWVVNITGADSGRTICNVEFKEPPLKEKILSQEGGTSAIEAKGTPDFSVMNGTDGLYASADEYGMSYYYRGTKNGLKNNLIWGGFQWKIVRINGDGSIRLIYNGTCPNDTCSINSVGVNTQLSETYAWNTTNYNDAKYVGYMYGGANGVASTVRNGTISGAATYNETSSNAKVQLDNWYQTNISGKPIEAQIVNNLFCNDRQLQNEVGGVATGPGYGNPGTITNYASYYRLVTNKIPTLKCELKNDRFTTSNDIIIGNGALIYPIGLITANEAAMAGLVHEIQNQTNYLYTNQAWVTLSPNNMNASSNSYMVRVDQFGRLNGVSGVQIAYGLRPAISLHSQTSATGEGTAANPYRVI